VKINGTSTNYLTSESNVFNKYDKELMSKLGNELFELWNECNARCDKINNLLKQLNKTKK
jgi:hypothetical protein